MVSMTGYASKEVTTEEFTLSIELKSYNNRYLDIKHNISNILSSFEMEIDSHIKQRIKRGSVEISIRLKQITNNVSLSVDLGMVQEYKSAFTQIAQKAKVPFTINVQDYIGRDGVITSTYNNDSAKYEHILFATLDEALDDFVSSKEKEGKAMEAHVKLLLSSMRDSLETIKTFSGSIEKRLKENLLKKIEEVMGSKEYDESRYLQEVALLLVKYSIQEEIIRLDTHFTAFEDILAQEGQVGKKLDFLCQEMNREINTIGSKSMIVEVNHLVVTLKDSLENMREQIRNIE
jgi:uncharacterized protein (TIGR00255 family)